MTFLVTFICGSVFICHFSSDSLALASYGFWLLLAKSPKPARLLRLSISLLAYISGVEFCFHGFSTRRFSSFSAFQDKFVLGPPLDQGPQNFSWIDLQACGGAWHNFKDLFTQSSAEHCAQVTFLRWQNLALCLSTSYEMLLLWAGLFTLWWSFKSRWEVGTILYLLFLTILQDEYYYSAHV